MDQQNTKLKETNQKQINVVNNKLDQQEVEIKLILQRHKAVSYTHLDVYKRQQ